MAEVLQSHSAETTLAVRTQELARTLKGKLAQGYRIESQNGTQAVLVMRGRKRWFGPSTDSRQAVSVDEFGATKFEKIDASG